MFSYQNICVAVLSISFLSNVAHAMDLAAVHAANQRAIAAAQAKQAADQRARDENWRRIQAQQAAERARAAQQQKKK